MTICSSKIQIRTVPARTLRIPRLLRHEDVLTSELLKMRLLVHWAVTSSLAIMVAGADPFAALYPFVERELHLAQVSTHGAGEGCDVELDASPAGKTNAQGEIMLQDVEPIDHYLHIRCPGQEETTYFISPRPGQTLEIHPETGSGPAAIPSAPPREPAEARIQLRAHLQQAIQLRTRGRIGEAVQHLRDAFKLDPKNPDLHRELGITFLLDKDWRRARVEMLEAVRRNPSDADAHNGLGYALEKLGELDAALKEYRTATRLDPEDSSYRQHYFDALGKLAAQKAAKKK